MLADQPECRPILIGTAARMPCDCLPECDANGRPNVMRICRIDYCTTVIFSSIYIFRICIIFIDRY